MDLQIGLDTTQPSSLDGWLDNGAACVLLRQIALLVLFIDDRLPINQTFSLTFYFITYVSRRSDSLTEILFAGRFMFSFNIR